MALFLSSLVFGCVHLVNDGESLIGVLSYGHIRPHADGALFDYPSPVAGYRVVAWSMELQYGSMGKIFSVSVSGSVINGLFKSTFIGPTLLTGSSVGLEGSLIAILVGIIATMLMLSIAVWRGNIIQAQRLI